MCFHKTEPAPEQIQRVAFKREISVKFGGKSVPTLDRAWAEESHQSSTKKLICFYGGTASLPPRSHLVALSSGRRGDTPPVGRQDALLKATGGRSGLTDTESAASPAGRLPASSDWGSDPAHMNKTPTCTLQFGAVAVTTGLGKPDPRLNATRLNKCASQWDEDCLH